MTKKESSFLQKRSKKLLLIAPSLRAQREQSCIWQQRSFFLSSFSSADRLNIIFLLLFFKKEVLLP
jgi:hypothetical protein